MDVDGVTEKFGVKPSQIIDYLSLVGDTSDNIPGVPSCGPKTAAKWLANYDSLQGVIENAESVKGKIGEKLRDAIPHLPMSHELATIRLDVELPKGIEELSIGEPDRDGLTELYKELEFKTWTRELAEGLSPIQQKGGSPAAAPATGATPHPVTPSRTHPASSWMGSSVTNVADKTCFK